MKWAVTVLAVVMSTTALSQTDATRPDSLSTTAEGVTLSVHVQQTTIRAGQSLQVEFILDRPNDMAVVVPAFKSPLGVWDIRAAQTIPPSTDAPNRISERLTLVTFESGQHDIPSVSFTLRKPDGSETPLASAVVPITVTTLLTDGFDPTRIRDVKGAVEIPLEPRWPWIVGLAVLVAVCTALGYHWWNGRNATIEPPEPPHIRALRELADLAEKKLPEKGLVLDFYVGLSNTVRQYVEGRFSLRAPEQTTKEFLQAARHHPLVKEDHQRMLAAFLRSADLVKFAAQRPNLVECDRGLEAARGFIRESAPINEQVSDSIALSEVHRPEVGR